MARVNPEMAVAAATDENSINDPEVPVGGSESDGNTKGLFGGLVAAGVGGAAGGTFGGINGATEGALPAAALSSTGGTVDGFAVGAAVASIVGAAVGGTVSLAVQPGDVALTHIGTNRSNCCSVSNTEAKKHSDPELLVILIVEDEKVFPKTTTFDTPTMLSLKHESSIVKGPKVSTRKLLVLACMTGRRLIRICEHMKL